MRRRLFLTCTALLPPLGALAQPAPPRAPAERHGWLGENWDSLAPEQRRQVEERFHRGMGPRGPDAEEMRRRWQAMSPEQRRELMFGPHMRPRRPPPPPPAPPPGGPRG